MRFEPLSSSWPGLSLPSTSFSARYEPLRLHGRPLPPTHDRATRDVKDVDARHKAGYDDSGRHRRQSGSLQATVLAAAAGFLLNSATPAASAPEMTDIALVLAVDVSESVTPERYALQMEGIARAFHDREVQGSILSGTHHSMYVTLVEWSNKPFTVLPWTLITSAEDADAFAGKIRAAPRADNQFTCLSRALETIGDKILPFLPVPAERTIVDVSGDGRDNCNPAKPVDAVRDDLVAAGATINGLPILEGDEAATLEAWYRAHVIGGPAAFLVPAHGFADVQRAMRQKFIVEISAN
jgi:hypothetical protein